MARVSLQLKEWNADKLLARSERILQDYAPVLAEETRRQIVAVKWTWPNSTLRFRSLYQGGNTERTKYGTGVRIPAGPRDIVDTGFLLSSQQNPVVQKNSLTIAWTAPYAKNILLGEYGGTYFSPLTRTEISGPGKKPPRNWISAALDERPPLRFFVQRWNELER